MESQGVHGSWTTNADQLRELHSAVDCLGNYRSTATFPPIALNAMRMITHASGHRSEPQLPSTIVPHFQAFYTEAVILIKPLPSYRERCLIFIGLQCCFVARNAQRSRSNAMPDAV